MENFTLTDEQKNNNIGYNLYHMTALLHRKMKKELDPIDITHTQLIILGTLYRLSESTKEITQIEIATNSMLDKMLVSQVLKTLQKKEMITRKEHPHDTRAKLVYITELGKLKLNEGYQIAKQVEQEFFKPLGKNKSVFSEYIQIIYNQNL